MDTEKEIHSLAGEQLAMQAILICVLGRLADSGLRQVITAGFDDAATYVEHIVIQFGKAANLQHTVKAIRVVEELRAAALGKQGKPKGVV